MKIIANKGQTPVRDVWFRDKKYFSTEEKKHFKPNDVIRLEDDLADFLLYTFGFLVEVSAQEGKRILEKSKKMQEKRLVCDVFGCKFETHLELALASHKKSHEGEEDIPMIEGTAKAELEKDEDSFYRKSEAQALRDGLIGEGVRHDSPTS